MKNFLRILIRYKWWVILLLISTIIFSYKMMYDWDYVAYMACAMQFEEKDDSTIHQEVYRFLEEEVSQEEFMQITQGNSYRITAFKDVKCFTQNLAFYKIKILYNGLNYLGIKAGISTQKMIVYNTLFFYFAIGILFIVVLSVLNINNIYKLLIFLVLLSLNIFTDLVRELTPDTMSTFFMLLIIYLLYFQKPFWAISASILAMIATRPDTIIFALTLLALWQVRNALQHTHQQPFQVGLTFVFSVILYLAIHYFAGALSWKTLFYHTFVHWVEYPETTEVSLSFSEYGKVLLKSIDNYIPYFLTILLLIAIYVRKISLFSPYTIVLVSVLLTLIIRFFLFPAISERFFAGFIYVIILTLIISQTTFIERLFNAKIRKE